MMRDGHDVAAGRTHGNVVDDCYIWKRVARERVGGAARCDSKLVGAPQADGNAQQRSNDGRIRDDERTGDDVARLRRMQVSISATAFTVDVTVIIVVAIITMVIAVIIVNMVVTIAMIRIIIIIIVNNNNNNNNNNIILLLLLLPIIIIIILILPIIIIIIITPPPPTCLISAMLAQSKPQPGRAARARTK
jgi:hypothetical protein